MIAVRAGAVSVEENIVAFLHDDASAGGQGLGHGSAGIAVAVLRIAAPDQDGRGTRIVHFNNEAADAAGQSLVIGNQRASTLFEKLHAAEALLGFVDLPRRVRKGGLERKNLIAERDLGLRVA